MAGCELAVWEMTPCLRIRGLAPVSPLCTVCPTSPLPVHAVLSRGSQYRVESMMARLAHTQNYLLVHSGREQVARQPAMEALPLVMEPRSRLYTDPLVVLDFQVH